MGIVDAIKNVSDSVDAVRKTHDNVKYFADTYGKKEKKKIPVTIHAPATTEVNKTVSITGTGTGMVSLYSGQHLERELYPDKEGEWYIRLFFSVPGTYDLTAVDQNGHATTTLIAKTT